MQQHYDAITKAIIDAIQDKQMRRIDLLRLFLVLYKAIGKIVDYLISYTFDDNIGYTREDLQNIIRKDN